MPEPIRATRHQIAEGLRVLMRAGGLDVAGCDYQRLYAGGPDPPAIGVEKVAELNKLGWHWEGRRSCWVIYVGGRENV
jgi:hypothetical protein